MTTSNGKWKKTSKIKNGISQQPLAQASPDFRLKLMWPKKTIKMFQMNTPSNGKMEEDLKK